ncbi:MAG: oxazoline/thiazoline synthase [Thermoanaerobaculia bacterium]|jgi:ribosomal protein S12 methylthiotransferase accessory factor|nr:oxazoline/thiazoline synthase [Thermoanaerobaculia bacterium]
MFDRPVFRKCFDVEIADDQHVLVFGEHDHYILNGPLFVWLTPLLRDCRPLADILDRANGYGELEVLYAVESLAMKGLIREAVASDDDAAEAFWDSVGADPAAASRAICASVVNVIGLGGASSSALTTLLHDSGVAAAGDPRLHIVLTGDYLDPEIAAINELRLRDGRPWLLARPHGSSVWLGPLLQPGESPCWECMATRMREQRLAGKYLQKRRGDSHPRLISGGSLPATERAAVALIATETLKWLGGAETRLRDALLTFDLAAMTIERHPVTRRTRCRACGDATPVIAAPVRLAGGRPITRFYRTETAEGTLAHHGHLVSRYTGVVSELTLVADIDAGVAPLYRAGPNAATADGSLETFRAQFRTASGGKGMTDAQAKSSALCEAIERYSGVFQGDEHRIRASYASLGDQAIHPNACTLFSDAQFERRHEAGGGRSTRVPPPFDEQEEVEWSMLWSLTGERFRYLPTALCYYGYQMAGAKPLRVADSNGCAAGATIEEAIVHGFFELVERDSVALWWFNRIGRPAVDLTSFADPYIDALRSYYRSLGRALWVLDLTSDLGIPSCVAVSVREDGPAQDIVIGFGAHFDAGIAVTRALTEANQFLPVVLSRHCQPDAAFKSADEDVLAWLRAATLENQPFLVPSTAPPVRRESFPRHDHVDLKEAVEACVAIARSRGLEVLVLDQTRDDIGLPVVRVVVPGLRPFWRRLAPGRLYDVPVAMGWRDAPATEETLNPIPVFF